MAANRYRLTPAAIRDLVDNQYHNLAHLHARYAEFEASIAIENGEILAGELPR